MSADRHRLALAALAVVLAGPASAAAGEGDGRVFYRDVSLYLDGALWRGSGEALRFKDLLLHLGFHEGAWRPYVLGYAGYSSRGRGRIPADRAYNGMDHEGTVREVPAPGGRVRLIVEMQINPDPWVPGGPARYSLDLARRGDACEGTFSGTFNGRDVKGKAAGSIRADPWPSPAEGRTRFEPGEHPRLIFRRSDLPALRKRMETKDGKAILDRLREILGREGKWTLWHGMGCGLLYQLTGEREYAALARQHVQYARSGERANVDGRYSYVRPGGKLRAGSSYAAVAMAYDLCYEAWDEGYRKGLARELDRKLWEGTDVSLVQAEPAAPGLVLKTGGGQHDPASNHYGAWNGGGGTAVLGILDDPGVDNERMTRAHRIFMRRAKRALEWGYGRSGMFYEGTHCGRLSCNTGLVTYLQALRVACGLDFVTNSPEARCLLLKHVYQVVRHEGKLYNPQRGMYAGPLFGRGGMSTGGDFAQGFGIVGERLKPAVLWFYNHIVCPGPVKDYDAINYPHRAVLAFVNWPIGVAEKNPAELLPRVLADRETDYIVFRSRWRDEDDVVAAAKNGMAQVMGMGLGLKGKGAPVGSSDTLTSDVTFALTGASVPDTGMDVHDGGACCVVYAGPTAFVADMTGTAGAPFVLVEIGGIAYRHKGPGAAGAGGLAGKLASKFGDKPVRQKRAPPLGSRWREGDARALTGRAYLASRERALGACVCRVLSIQRGPLPRLDVRGEGPDRALVVGRRTIAVRGEKVVIGKLDQAP